MKNDLRFAEGFGKASNVKLKIYKFIPPASP